MINRFAGIIPALHTPFDDEGNVDLRPLPRWLGWLKSVGVGGFFLCGSSGEGFFLTPQERMAFTEAVIKELAGELPVVVHVGAMDQRAAVELARHAAKAGAHGISSVMPFYYPYSLAEARAYYQALADASGLPLICYIYSGSQTAAIQPEAFAESVGQVRGLYGLKYTAADLFQMQAIRLLMNDRIELFGGYDELALPFLSMGVKGLIGLNYNFMPEPFVALYEAFRRNDMAAAMARQRDITGALQVLQKCGLLQRGKGGCFARGLPIGKPRPPTSWLSPAQFDLMRATFKKLGLGPIPELRRGPRGKEDV